MAKSMIAMKANKKMVQNHLMKDTGKVVLLKDLHNIAAKAKQQPGRNSLTELISQMKKSPGNCTMEPHYSNHLDPRQPFMVILVCSK
jgi:hypothetical protein